MEQFYVVLGLIMVYIWAHTLINILPMVWGRTKGYDKFLLVSSLVFLGLIFIGIIAE